MTGLAPKIVKMGLGNALRRLTMLDRKTALGVANATEKSECNMLFEALNELEIDIGFDCNDDGVPDDVTIFRESSESGCCRLLPVGTDRKRKARSGRRKK